MQRDVCAARGKLPPAFLAGNLLQAQHFTVKPAHLVLLGGKQDHARHFYQKGTSILVFAQKTSQSSKSRTWICQSLYLPVKFTFNDTTLKPQKPFCVR